MSKPDNRIDELGAILHEYRLECMATRDRLHLNGDVNIDKLMEATKSATQAIEALITQKINEAEIKARMSQTNDLNTKIFHTYANPKGQYIKDLLMQELDTLRSQLNTTKEAMMSKIIQNKATRPDNQRYDKVDIYTVPRWKESRLSGDEYRISCNAYLYYKGNLVKRMNFSDVEAAIRYLDGALVYWRENGDDHPNIDDSYLCDQEGCASIADVKYKRLDAWTSRGDKETLYDWNLYRVFCNSHRTRGDCALDDADRNYEQVDFLQEEQVAIDRLRNGGEL